MNDDSIIGYCDCSETCHRWGVYEDGSGGYFCPYVPEQIGSNTNKCKKLSIFGKDIQPTQISKINLGDK